MERHKHKTMPLSSIAALNVCSSQVENRGNISDVEDGRKGAPEIDNQALNIKVGLLRSDSHP